MWDSRPRLSGERKLACGVGCRYCWISQSDNGEPLLRPYIQFAGKWNSM